MILKSLYPKIQLLKCNYSFVHNDRSNLFKKISLDVIDELYIPIINERLHKYRSDVDIIYDYPLLNYSPYRNYPIDIYSKVDPKLVYNKHTDKNLADKVEFHKLAGDREYIPKTVFSIEDTNKLKFPIIAKPAFGHSGIGIKKFDNIEDLQKSDLKFDLYSECIDYKKEFRCIFIKDKIIVIFDRVLNNKLKKSIINKDINESVTFVYIEQDLDKLPFIDELLTINNELRKDVIDLDIYSLDFFLDKNDKLKIIEVNSASLLSANILCYYYKSICEDAYNKPISNYVERFSNNIMNTYYDIIKNEYLYEYKDSYMPIKIS